MTLHEIRDLHPGAVLINTEQGFNPVLEAFDFVDEVEHWRHQLPTDTGIILTDSVEDAFFIDAQTLNHCVVDPGEADEWLLTRGYVYDGSHFRPLNMPAHEFNTLLDAKGMQAAVDYMGTPCYDYYRTEFADAWNALEAYRYTLIAPCVQAAMIRYTLD